MNRVAWKILIEKAIKTNKQTAMNRKRRKKNSYKSDLIYCEFITNILYLMTGR